MAERSKALVLGTSLFGGVGSNPTAAKLFAHVFFPTYAVSVVFLQEAYLATSNP